jgi:hypothetical protein
MNTSHENEPITSFPAADDLALIGIENLIDIQIRKIIRGADFSELPC